MCQQDVRDASILFQVRDSLEVPSSQTINRVQTILRLNHPKLIGAGLYCMESRRARGIWLHFADFAQLLTRVHEPEASLYATSTILRRITRLLHQPTHDSPSGCTKYFWRRVKTFVLLN